MSSVKMFGAASKAGELMFGAIRRMSRAYNGEERSGEKEKSGERRVLGRDELGPLDVQFPVSKVKKEPLQARAGWMRDMDIFRYIVEPKDSDGSQDIALEAWSIGRCVHNRINEIGNLYRVRINWDLATISLNVIGIKDEVPLSLMPSVMDTGDGLGYVIRRRDFETYRLFGKGRCVDGPAMGARLLYLCCLDLDEHQCVTLSDFEQWPAELVLKAMEDHVAGETFRRPDADEAGLVCIRRLGSDPVRTDDDLWMDGNDTETSGSEVDLGQSPSLSSTREAMDGSSNIEERPRVEDKAMTGAQMMAVSGIMEECRNAPPPVTNIRDKVFQIRFGQGTGLSGSGPGGWRLDDSDWLDIQELRLKDSSGSSGDTQSQSLPSSSISSSRSEEINGNDSASRPVLRSDTSSGSYVSPRAELSNANMSGMSSMEMLLASPEQTMRGVVRQHMLEGEGEPDRKRKREKSSSSESMSSLGVGSVDSMVFSPILSKGMQAAINVSTASSDMSGGSEARGQNLSPVFNFNLTNEMRSFSGGQVGPIIWGGMPMGNPMAPSEVARRMPMPGPGDVRPNIYIDDMSVGVKVESAMADQESDDESEEEGVDHEEVFDLSQVE